MVWCGVVVLRVLAVSKCCCVQGIALQENNNFQNYEALWEMLCKTYLSRDGQMTDGAFFSDAT